MKIYFYYLLGIFLLFTSTLHAQTSLWKISNDQTTLFLGGTVHILSSKDYPLPCEFNVAYQQASKIMFETNADDIQSPEFGQQLLKQASYPGTITLANKLSPGTYKRLAHYLTSRGIPIEKVIHFKPGLLMSIIMVTELRHNGIDAQGVDDYFAQKAKNDKKPRLYLESIQQQMTFIAELGVNNEEQFINYLLHNMHAINIQFTSMVNAWRSGNLENLSRLSDIETLKKEFPQIFKILLTDRNNVWLPQIEALLNTPDIELILVGALHLANDDGLLAQLKARGYNITQVTNCAKTP